jgi:hypothetical protein
LSFGWDEEARVLYLPTWWKYNCPENPNVLKACLSDLHEVPQTRLLIEFSRNLKYLPETFHETFRQGLPKPSPQPCPNQEQEQEQEQEGASAPESLFPNSGPLEGFPEFYVAYPRHEHREAAESAWKQLKPNAELRARLLEDVKIRITNNWAGRPKGKIPLPATYLNGKHWTDEIYGANESVSPRGKVTGLSKTEQYRLENGIGRTEHNVTPSPLVTEAAK